MERVTDMIMLAVEVLVTALVIVAVFSLFRSAQSFANQTTTTINTASMAVEQAQFLKYDGLEVSGSDAVSVGRRYGKALANGVKISTTNNSGSTTVIGGSTFDWGGFQNLPANPNYVNPASTYVCEVTKDANTGYVVSLSFSTKTYVSPLSASAVAGAAGSPSEYAVGGGTGVSGYSLRGREYPDASAAATEEPEDLSVIFSDEQEPMSEGAEEKQALGAIRERLEEIEGSLKSLSDKIALLDESSADDAVAAEIGAELEQLRSRAVSLRKKYGESSELSESNRKFVRDSADNLVKSIDAALKSVNDLAGLSSD